jgi:GDSL-like Lipase/Acylhydrolase family
MRTTLARQLKLTIATVSLIAASITIIPFAGANVAGSSPPASESVPVVNCPIAGSSSVAPPVVTIPPTISLPQGTSIFGTVDVASTTAYVLGPTGYGCVANGNGADGGLSLTLTDPADSSHVIYVAADAGGAGPNVDLSCAYIPEALAVDTAFRGNPMGCSHPKQDKITRVATKTPKYNLALVRVPAGVNDSHLPSSGGPNPTVALFAFHESGPATLPTRAPCKAQALVQAEGGVGIVPIGTPTCVDGYAIQNMAPGGPPQGQQAGFVFKGNGSSWTVLGGGDPWSVGQACSRISLLALKQFQQLPPGLGCPSPGTSPYVATTVGGEAQEADCTLVAKQQNVCAAALELFLYQSKLGKNVGSHLDGVAKDVNNFVNPAPSTYVAMGDSYSSGEGADWPAGFGSFPQLPGCDWSLYQDSAGSPSNTDSLGNAYIETSVDSGRAGHCNNGAQADQTGDTCHRAITAYPHVLDKLVSEPNRKLAFVACSGATVHDAIVGYPGNQVRKGEGSQLLALNTHTSLVTLTLGGNDVNFAGDAKTCVTPGQNEWDCLSPDPSMLHTLGYITTPGNDDGKFTPFNAKAIVPPPDLSSTNVAQKLNGLSSTISGYNLRDRLTFFYLVVHKLAPHARILVLGYPEFFPNNPTDNAAHFSVQEQQWVNERIATLNNVIQSAVWRSGVTQYVDVYNVLADGHQLVNGGHLDFGVDGSGNATCNGGEYINDVDLPEGHFNSPELLHPNPCGHQLEGQRVADAYNNAVPARQFYIPQLPPAVQIELADHHSNFPFGCHATFKAVVDKSRASAVKKFTWFDRTGNQIGTGDSVEMDTNFNHPFQPYLRTTGYNGQVRYSFGIGNVC